MSTCRRRSPGFAMIQGWKLLGSHRARITAHRCTLASRPAWLRGMFDDTQVSEAFEACTFSGSSTDSIIP